MKFLMYKEKYHPQVKKDIKKLDPQVRTKIKDLSIPKILENPQIGVNLVGDLTGVRSYHVIHGRQQYRIAYIVDDYDEVVYFIMVAKRGDFYTLLKKRV